MNFRNNTSTSPQEPKALNTDTGRHSPDVNSTRVDDEITFKKQGKFFCCHL